MEEGGIKKNFLKGLKLLFGLLMNFLGEDFRRFIETFLKIKLSTFKL